MSKIRVSAIGLAAALGVGLFASSAAADEADTQWVFGEDGDAGAQWVFGEDGDAGAQWIFGDDGGDLGLQWWY